MPDQQCPSAAARRRRATTIAAGVPELGWSCCEALFMPLLLGLRVPDYLLTVCWLFSPVLGLFLHPCVGRLSDTHGRRPWTILFGVLAALGLVVTPLCVTLLAGSPGVAAVAAIIAFGITDTSHDLLVTPIRAAMNDLFDTEDSERRSAIAAAVGKIFGQCCATFLHSTAAFVTTAGLVAAATATQCLAPPAPPCESCSSCEAGNQVFSSPARRAPMGFTIVWMLQFAGWVSICTISFYFTSVWAELAGCAPGTPEFNKEVHFACGLLMGNSFIFVAAGMALPSITRICGGELRATAASVLTFAMVMLSFGYTPRPVVAAGVLLALPLAYQVVTNVPFAWLERQPGFAEAERGKLTGWLNASLAAAQTVTALSSGPLVAAMGGQLVVTFRFVAALDVIILMAAACLALGGRRGSLAQPLAGVAA
mmetsp:Transcript_90216/g.269167  ORF Transcript_90216/g.269167 Transcript_90216/m.269167 type:complete len:424 (-) Transcript_90216:13-1284(-)